SSSGRSTTCTPRPPKTRSSSSPARFAACSRCRAIVGPRCDDGLMSSTVEPGDRDLIGEWRKLMESMLTSAASSVGARVDVPRQLVEPMQRQLELVQVLIEREREVQRQITGRLVAPFDVIFDLLE